jgi:methionine biosynthesis protein MetW
MLYQKNNHMRLDLEIIADLIFERSRILDLGCGTGELLNKLIHHKQCQGHGVELYSDNICSCVKKGVPVIQANLDEGLGDYPDSFFDYVVLSRTLQVIRKPNEILKEMLRVGEIGIVSFPNFGYLKVRLYLFFRGIMPVTKSLPFEWYNTPNIHLLTIKDFWRFCYQENIQILKQINLGGDKKAGLFSKIAPNLFAQQAIFMVRKKD